MSGPLVIEAPVIAHDGAEDCVVQAWLGGVQRFIFARFVGLHVGDIVVLRLADAEAKRGEILGRARGGARR